MANTIEWNGMSAFAKLELSPLELAGVEVAQAKTHQGLTFLQIDAAGHMGEFARANPSLISMTYSVKCCSVPIDQPAASSLAIGSILSVLGEGSQ